MDDDILLAYALKLLDPADRAAVEAHLMSRPDDTARLERVRHALRPMEADRDGYDPPHGLAIATIARTAKYLVANGLIPVEPELEETPRPVPASVVRRPDAEPLFPPGWRHADALVAAGIAFLAFGLLVAGIGRLRHDSQVAACQDGLRNLHVALTDYSDTHDGRYPAVGTRQVPTAGAFATELARTGHLPPGQRVGCPVTPFPEPQPQPVVPAVGYTYTLGFVGPGDRVTGLQRSDVPTGASDWTAVSADLPVSGPRVPHSRGLNVLYLGGMVRFAANPAAGVNGDDIYHNEAGLVRAGLHVHDASLGRPNDIP